MGVKYLYHLILISYSGIQNFPKTDMLFEVSAPLDSWNLNCDFVLTLFPFFVTLGFKNCGSLDRIAPTFLDIGDPKSTGLGMNYNLSLVHLFLFQLEF